ncbi:two-partner secretion domain-containing protein, partial [Microvirgula aerodenitrificans]|uniref:two-partner secretion domain-containing protein n=1 Tax=Microvirgula aerodenitrificans TaxID=57480 RepID=UPI00248E0FD6
MNKNLYRVVFSRARGLFVVVAERVTGQHKTSAQSPASGPGRRVVTLRPIGLALLAAFGGIAPVHGQIVADPGAPKNQQPTIVNSANGTPQVNIRTPSAAGVSRNTYSQFDVNQQGAILNNARTSAQTQLGGWVQANPWLARGTAKVILNEVNGSHPSQLRGYIEVAGDRAQVVIANPAGISCDGCGFINANRATLTTGQPILNGGHLDGYRVQQGVINIGGAGLDASKTDFTDIIARAVNVNAGIWASTLKVSAGANQVDATHERVEATTSSSTAPGYAIDVASLGGMYAGKILLVGTEHGVGVRNAGEIGAGVGDVTLTAAGMLENRGRITAAGTVGVDSDAGIVNHGTVYAQGDSRLSTRGDIDNRGLIVAGANAALAATGTGSRIDNHGQLIRAVGDVSVSADHISNADTLGSDQGIDGRSVSITARDIDNRAGAMRADQALTLTGAGHLDNQNGLLSSGQTVAVRDQSPGPRSQTVSNDGGTLIAGRQLSIDSAGLDGNGKLLSQGDLSLSLSGDYTQTGTLIAAGNATLTFGGTLSNQARLEAGSTLTVSAANLDNSTSGSLRGDRTRLSASDTLSNRGLIDGRETLLQADTVANIGSGRIYGDQLSIGATTLRNDTENGASASVAARDRLDLGVHTLVNREHALLFSAGDLAIGGTLGSDGRATGAADHVGNHSASIEALNGLSLNAFRVENSNEHFRTEVLPAGGPTRIIEYQGTGAIARYLPGTPGVYVFNDESDQLMTPEGRYESWSQYDYTRTIKESKVVESDPGRITAGGNLVLNADSVLNSNSRITAGGALQASVRDLNNTEVIGQQIVTDSGTSTSYWRKHNKGRDSTESETRGYNPTARIYDIRLTPTVYQANTAPVGSGTQVAALALDGSIRTVPIDTRVAPGSLFRPAPDPSARYLVETDPAFANYRTWMSSDYLFDQLRTDPSSVQKRLGDGFYEQKLVREQVAQLTGRRFLNGYASDEAQYRALLDNAVTYASKWDLRPGVALTPEQMARLTSDIVWLVEQDVTLPDGRTTRALVPQVYVQVRNGDLDGSGALIAGSSLKLDLSGDLNNMGTLAGRDIVSLSAENLKNLGGRITGSHVDVRARTDLDNIGGTIDAGKQLSAIAGRDLNLITTTRSNSNEQSSVTHVARVAGLYVTDTSAGLLSASAGRDVNIVGAQIDNRSDKGLTVVDAGRDLNLGTVATSRRQSLDWGSGNWRKDGSDEEVGSTLQVAGDIRLSASRDLNARAATVTSSDGAVAAVAGRDVNLTAGSARNFVDEAHRHTGSNGMLSKKTITTRDSVDETVALGTTFSGKTTQVQAGRDLLVDGSNVVSDKGTALVAGRDVRLQSATDTTIESHLRDEKKSGLFSSGGIGFTIGTQQQTADRRATSTRAAASTVGATEGNVAIVAGETYSQTGSKVVAPHGDIGIDARRVDIVEARENSHSTYETHFKQTGLTVALTSPILSAIETAQQMKRAASQVSDGRLQALAGATTALAGKNAYDAVTAENGAGATGVNISITVGQSKSASLQTQDSSQGAASTVAAGGNIGIRASGAGKDSDLTVRGSDIRADGKVQLLADNDIALLAGKDTASQKSTNSSSSAGVGVAISVGSNGMAIGITANASAARGKADGSDVNWRNSHVTAGDTLIMQSGGDTTLRGAVVSGRQVLADIGGDLTIESLQDTSKYKSKNQSIGGSVTVGVGFSGSVNVGQQKMNSDYASVSEQSGIKAGDGGFLIDVGGHTGLTGGVIASRDKAVQDGLNRLTTGTLSTSDINNHASYSASSVSLGGGYSTKDFSLKQIGGDATPAPAAPASGVGTSQDGMATTGGDKVPGSELPAYNGWSATAPIAMGAKGSGNSTTHSGISGGTVVITDEAGQQARTGQSAAEAIAALNRDVSSDKDGSNTLKPIFDKDKIEAGFAIVGALQRETGTFLNNRAKETTQAKADLDKELAKPESERDSQKLAALTQQIQDNATWEMGGSGRLVLTALTAGAGANVTGGAVDMLQGAAANYLQGLATQQVKEIADKLDSEVARAALQGLVACAGAAAQGGSCGAGASGAAASVVLNNLL